MLFSPSCKSNLYCLANFYKQNAHLFVERNALVHFHYHILDKLKFLFMMGICHVQ
jgi:hypothetical protein